MNWMHCCLLVILDVIVWLLRVLNRISMVPDQNGVSQA